MLVPSPSPELFRTDRFDEFSGAAHEHFAQVDAREALQQIGQDELAEMRWHPGGFMVVYITPPEIRAEGQQRIHIWPDGIDRDAADTHMHPWFLAGYDIDGTYVEYRPTVTPSAEPESSGWVRVIDQFDPADPDRVHLSVGERVDVNMGEPHVYGPGQVHVLPPGVYHQTPVSGPVITWCAMGVNRFPASYIRPAQEPIPSIEQPRRSVTDQDRRLAQRLIRESLNRVA